MRHPNQNIIFIIIVLFANSILIVNGNTQRTSLSDINADEIAKNEVFLLNSLPQLLPGIKGIH